MPGPSQNLVGVRVKEARKAATPPLTQEQLSALLAEVGIQIDRAGIAKIETGIRGVLDFEVVALSRALNVDALWLLQIKN